MGDDNVNLVLVDARDRFAKLQQGEVDVLASSDTHTMQRDVYEVRMQSIFYVY